MGLDRLTAIVVDNFSATYGWPDGIDDALRARGLDDRERARAATTTRSSGRSRPASRAGRTPSSRWWGHDHGDHAASASRASPREALDDDPRLALVLADIGVDSFEQAGARAAAPRARDQRRHPRAAHDRRRGRAGAGGHAARSSTATRRSSSSGRSSRSSSTSATRTSARCSSASARPTTPRPRAARTRRPGDVALLATVPGFAIHVPGHPDEVEQLLRREFARDGRAYVRLSAETNAEAQPVEQLTVVREGARRQSARARRRADARPGAGRDRRPRGDGRLHLDRRGRSPRPSCARSPRAAATSSIVEPYLAGTSAAALADALRDEPRRLLALGVPPLELRRYGRPEEHRRAYGLDAAGIRRSLDAFLPGALAAA